MPHVWHSGYTSSCSPLASLVPSSAQVSAIAMSSVLGALARHSRWSEALEALETMHCAQRGEEQMHQVP